MNIPPIYLIEPYNAYAPKGRKKHWMEIVEEQALMERIIADQQAAQQQALLEAQSKTLPPNSPNISSPTVGNMAAGAGGIPVNEFFHPIETGMGFTATPTNGDAPLTVTFKNTTPDPQFVTSFLWNFGDGTGSYDASPTHIYQSGSAAGYKVALTASFLDTATTETTSSYGYISASIPTVTSLFTFITSSQTIPFTAVFTNASTNTSNTPTTIYSWSFGDGTALVTDVNPTHTYVGLSSNNNAYYTASLQATGSYNIASRYAIIFSPDPTADQIILKG